MEYRNKEWLKEKFNKYKKVSIVAKETGYPRTCIARYATRFGIYEKKFTRETVNHVNEEYFKVINSREKAYFLGFIMADGNMHEREDGRLQFSIKVKNTDKDILIKFAKAIDFDPGKIKDKISKRKETITKACVLTIYNTRFCENLINKGVISNKGSKESMNVSDVFKRDFIRGFIDGDGWIGRDRNRIGYGSMSKQIVEDISEYLKQELDISFNITKDKNIFRVDIYDRIKVYKIVKYIYYDKCIALNRKKELANITIERILNLFGSL